MKKNKLVPRLRFQEFKNSPSWDITNLGKISSVIEEKAGKNKYIPLSVTSGIGLISQTEKFGREIAGNSYKNYIVIRKYDFAYNKSATKQFPEGFISMLNNYDIAAVPNSIFICFRITDKQYYPNILNYLFYNNYHGYWLRKYIEVGGRAHGSLNFDTKHLWDIPIVLPSLEEQKKIADCLDSIDELIEAEKRKLEVLKKYKKALMQKLFPSEDSSIPELRFAEFKDSGEWENKKLSEIGKFIRGFSYKGEDTTNDTSKLLIIRSNNIIPMGITDYKNGLQYVQKPCKEEQKLITGDITICMANGSRDLVGKASFYDGMYSGDITVGAFCGIFRSKLNITRYLFQTNLYKKKLDIILSGGNGSIANLRGEDILNLSFYIPKNFQEQQKIADCLASIDSIIDSQVKRIDNLIKHKKALMQGLFPDMESIEEYE
ncbi:restriction endonuclease subunit S [Brachyspira hampsonii]|uniref:Restriction modification system DNA specificity subunit n=1 Tax=Brachyspira hampsonii 30446 TaxID=1289135 RepID=A0A2U4EZW2_9SPIR|nr:restriction endonuclease subunit S [Brachyspira hampsonii]EKV57322.1 restriction modification system DNA specificity subunit [Brachyspira hampsonii 30446]MBW5389349.1 restriction endonuclease subunit S [Brachyspira hampsonii]MBW5394416.1 restriction endonuclease subunit S [Brachyspira hampsonii]OEJ18550.1 hypothetical protein A9495_05675 [Brachyspira hampsonii]